MLGYYSLASIYRHTHISDDDYFVSCAEAISAYKVTKQSKIRELSFTPFQLSLNSFPTNVVAIPTTLRMEYIEFFL
jgi:hypothetical protein